MSYLITKVDEGFYRSPRPTKDQLAQWKLTYGIGAILNLEGDAPEAVRIEKTDCNQLGIDESYMRWSGVNRPSVEAVIEGVELIRANQKAKIITLGHCLHGVDRTGILCAGYHIIYEGWDVEKAWQEAISFGLHWYVYWWWRKTLVELKGGE